MKKLTLTCISSLILLSLLLSAVSCKTQPPAETTGNPEETSAEPIEETTAADETTAEETTAADTTAETTPPPSEEEIAAIKAEVIALMMADSDKESPTTLFEAFIGDYAISDIDQLMSNGGYNAYSKIFRNDDTLGMVYLDGVTTDYTVYRNDFAYTAYKDALGNTSVTGKTSLGGNTYTPSILTDFGFDISAIYSGNISLQDPTLDASMLTVSNDLMTCSFSDDYMTEVGRGMCASLGYNDADTEKFFDTAKLSGVYYPQEKRVEFVIEFYELTLGETKITLTCTDKGTKGITYSTKMEFNVVSSGMIVPTTTELIISEVKYDGNRPISGQFELRSIASVTLDYNGSKVSSDAISITTYSLFAEGENTPRCSAKLSQTTTTTVESGGKTEKTTETVLCELVAAFGGKQKFSFSQRYNGNEAARLEASTLTLTPDDSCVLPDEISSAIDQDAAV